MQHLPHTDIGPSSSAAPSSELHHPSDDTRTHPDQRAVMIFFFFFLTCSILFIAYKAIRMYRRGESSLSIRSFLLLNIRVHPVGTLKMNDNRLDWNVQKTGH